MTVVAVTPGVYTDAGGFIIYIGSDGKVHVKKVPPWDGPEMRRGLAAAVHVLDIAAQVKDAKVEHALVEAGKTILASFGAKLGQEFEALGKVAQG